jgi:hypothetical protein
MDAESIPVVLKYLTNFYTLQPMVVIHVVITLVAKSSPTTIMVFAID